jgi:hypothetical protein
MNPDVAIPAEIKRLVDAGAMFVINHSGGKDSQAMTLYLERHIPRAIYLVADPCLERARGLCGHRRC